MKSTVVAIDGPGGSGKTSVSRAVALRLQLPHLDTGAYYRAATLVVLRAGADPADEVAVVGCLTGTRLEYDHGRMMLEGNDVSAEIRSDPVTKAVSAVSSYPAVREQMVALQRSWVQAREGRAVVEGRDIGTVVFPDAALKLFLTARPEVRARRRAAEHPESQDASVVESDLARRDTFDSTRAASPLQRAEDAVVIDTSDMSMDQVIDQAAALGRSAMDA